MRKHCIILLFFCVQLLNSYPIVTEINPNIKLLTEQVNIDSLEYYIRYMQNLGPRPANNTKSTKALYLNNILAKNWLYQQYKTFDSLEVYFNHFIPENQCDSVWVNDSDFVSVDSARNVVAVQKGTKYPEEYIVVCSHLDTYAPGEDSDYRWNSSGADDNASGTVGVIEIARILSKYKFKRSIIYLNNNGEEVGVTGANIFAHNCRKNNINILGVFNLDMIGYNPIDMPLKIFYNDMPPINKEFAKYFSKVADLYLSDIPALPNQNKNISGWVEGRGDCYMFIKYDYPAMYMGDPLGEGLEGYFSTPCYHTIYDTIGIGKKYAGVNSLELVKGYTQVTLAAISELAELDYEHIVEVKNINYNIIYSYTKTEATLKVDIQYSGNLHIILHDLLGRELFELHNGFVNNGIFTKTFSIEALPIGSYYLKIFHNGNLSVGKIVVSI